MKTEREPFLANIRRLKPATADKSPIEGLNHIWFSEAAATAYNDVIGIEVPCESPIIGGVAGSTLLGLLEALGAKEVDLTADNKDGSALSVKAPGSSLKLPLLPLERSVFDFPKTPAKGVGLDNTFLLALRHVMIAVSSEGDNMGVTLAPEGGFLSLYATDGMVIAWATIEKPKGYGAKRVVLSPVFCSQLLALAEDDTLLFITDDNVIATSAVSGVRLFGRLVETPKELDFAGTIAANVPDIDLPAIPEKLAASLDRAEVLVAGVSRAHLRVSVKDGVLRLALKSDLGELNEALKLVGAHEEAAGEFNAAFLRRGIGKLTHFSLSRQCFGMVNNSGYGFMVAASVK